MKAFAKKIVIFLLAVLTVISGMFSVFAVDSEVVYVGDGEKFVFTPGSNESPTDLFVDYKKVMPGDVLTQKVNIVNTFDECDYVNIYLQAIPHDTDKNPLSETVDQILSADKRNTGDKLAYMNDFLSKLHLQVKNGRKIIFDASADQQADLKEPVFLCSLEAGEGRSLEVLLTIPADLDDTYAARIGEIDWKFIAEQQNEDHEEETTDVTVRKVWKDGNSQNRPESITIDLLRNNKVYESVILDEETGWLYSWKDLPKNAEWSVQESGVPKGYKDTYSSKRTVHVVTNTASLKNTGQLNWPIPVLLIAGICCILFGISLVRRGKKHA